MSEKLATLRTKKKDLVREVYTAPVAVSPQAKLVLAPHSHTFSPFFLRRASQLCLVVYLPPLPRSSPPSSPAHAPVCIFEAVATTSDIPRAAHGAQGRRRAHNVACDKRDVDRLIGNESDGGVVEMNKAVLAGMVTHPDWKGGQCDTRWLEREPRGAIRIGTGALKPGVGGFGLRRQQGADEVAITSISTSASGSGSLAMQPGAIFHPVLSPSGSKTAWDRKKHNLTLASIAHNTSTTRVSGTLQSTVSPHPSRC
ncbi:hypothetical protein FIBSPDRAFT_952431 [Athelia psychrophila]|uniref:Uncharacterized protein n=1 Tax=Athelia psychrophila TaxID=1759441 RepID=A0A166LE24_9AGAM|nr:hypothetical protein FIBSPDRAFT_952431 [Fibularhizoctonia sp. CBS 109695]